MDCSFVERISTRRATTPKGDARTTLPATFRARGHGAGAETEHKNRKESDAMKSFCKTGLVLFVSLGWAVSSAQAKSDAYAAPSLLPLPAAAPILGGPATAS